MPATHVNRGRFGRVGHERSAAVAEVAVNNLHALKVTQGYDKSGAGRRTNVRLNINTRVSVHSYQ